MSFVLTQKAVNPIEIPGFVNVERAPAWALGLARRCHKDDTKEGHELLGRIDQTLECHANDEPLPVYRPIKPATKSTKAPSLSDVEFSDTDASQPELDTSDGWDWAFGGLPSVAQITQPRDSCNRLVDLSNSKPMASR